MIVHASGGRSLPVFVLADLLCERPASFKVVFFLSWLGFLSWRELGRGLSLFYALLPCH